MPTNTPSISQLKRAVEISERIDKLQQELNSILGSSASAPAAASPAPAASGKRRGRPPKSKLSPEARERIAAAQRARWAKVKGTAVAAAPAKAGKPGRKRRGRRRAVSAEARAKMAEAARRRWAALKRK